MKISTNSRHQWTKEDIKVVMTQWESNTTEEISEQLGVSKGQISYVAKELRLAGHHLPKKRRNGYMRNLIAECISDLGGKPISYKSKSKKN